MKVWLVIQNYCSCMDCWETVMSVHLSEEGAYLKEEELSLLNEDETLSYYTQEWDVDE